MLRASKLRVIKGLVWLTLLMVLGQAASAHELTFLLVPKKDWNQGQPSADAFLESGRVLLFKHGSFEPDLVVEANLPQAVPSGTWYWIAEAPGYVSTTSGVIRLDDDEPISRRLIWSVVPACEVDFRRIEWRGISRLDLVSLDHHATYPITRRNQSSRWIPAGRFLSYTTDPRGIVGISTVRTCQPGDSLELSKPEPPANDRQAVVANVQIPVGEDGEVKVNRSLLQASIKNLDASGTTGPRSPDALVWVEERATFFFLDLEALGPFQLSFEHPGLRTARLEFAEAPGEVQELKDFRLQNRVAVDFVVDYRPQRPHAREELVMLRCGDQPRQHLVELDRRSCQPVGEPQLLQAGLYPYRFEGLDVGWHVPSAQIDAEELPGLGSWTSLMVDGQTSSPMALDAHLLEELHIYGQILNEGDPVEGEIRLDPIADFSGLARRYPTDDELFYHLFYFAQEPLDFGLRRLPEDVQKRDRESLKGLFFGQRLSACDADSFCKLFHIWSTFSGEGQLDFELGATKVAIQVIDAESRGPIPTAQAAFSHDGEGNETFHFVSGEAFAGSRPAGEALAAFADSRGEIRIRDVKAGIRRLTVMADGYTRSTRELAVPAAGRLDVEVELHAIGPRGGLTLLFPDGRSVSGVALLALQENGATDYACTRATNSLGEIEIPGGCLEGERVFLALHPGVRFQKFSVSALRQTGHILVERASPLPRRVRLMSTSGLPLAFVPLKIRVQGITLTPNHFLAAASRGGRSIPLRTDHRGEAVLAFLDPDDPAIEVSLSPTGRWWTLAGRSGQIEEVVVD